MFRVKDIETFKNFDIFLKNFFGVLRKFGIPQFLPNAMKIKKTNETNTIKQNKYGKKPIQLWKQFLISFYF